MENFLVGFKGASGGSDKGKEKQKKGKPVVNKESTIKRWKKDWLVIEKKGGKLGIACQACRAVPHPLVRGAMKTDPFIEGTLNVKKYVVDRHESSTAHKHAYESWKNRSKEAIITAVSKMNKEEHDRMVKLFDISYHLAKHEQPFTYFTALVNLEKRHGVDLGSTYINPTQTRTFTKFLADDIRQGIIKRLSSVRYISILTDGSTDRSVKEKELVYVKYLVDNVPEMSFYGIQDVENAKADGVLDCINSMFIERGNTEWKKNLVGFGADGAAVNFGKNEGIFAKLHHEMPWLMGIHCVAHRLELAAKDAFRDTFFTKEVDSFLSFYAGFYRKSPKRLREFNELAEALEQSVLRPTRVDGTRWVDHRRRALLALERNFPVVVAHLNDVGSDERQDIKREDAAKIRGWVKKISSCRFLLHMALYMDILEELSHLSLIFQRDNVSLPDVHDNITTSQEVLCEMVDNNGPKLQAIMGLCAEGTYKGVTLTDVESSRASFPESRRRLIEPVVKCLEVRFGSISTNPVFSAATKLDPKNWPSDLQGYGDTEVKVLLHHFHSIITAHGCDTEAAMAEWVRLKKIVRKYYNGVGWQELWSRIMTERHEDFSNIFHLIEIIQVIPLATSKVERAFSLMNRVKSDWRVSLDTSTVDDLMVISLEGPDEMGFNVESAVTSWFKAGKQPRRPHVQPYGPRKGDKEVDDPTMPPAGGLTDVEEN